MKDGRRTERLPFSVSRWTRSGMRRRAGSRHQFSVTRNESKKVFTSSDEVADASAVM